MKKVGAQILGDLPKVTVHGRSRLKATARHTIGKGLRLRGKGVQKAQKGKVRDSCQFMSAAELGGRGALIS